MTDQTRWAIDTAYATNNAGFTAANFNSLADGSCVVGSSAITNGGNLDQYATLSFVFTVGGTTGATSRLDLYLLPLNQDGSTYGDGTVSGAATPSAEYLVSSVGVRSGVASGSTVTGTFPPFILPPGNFVLVIASRLGVTMSAAATAGIAVRTFNENLNA